MKKINILCLLMITLTTPLFAVGPYVDNGNGTVTDKGTGLIWQQTDDGVERTWEEALEYCESLTLDTKSDWRLPNIRELETIVDDSLYGPAINTDYFKNAKSDVYWSGSTLANYTDYAWNVYFISGNVDYYYKTDDYYVRCVRSGSSGSFDPLTLSITASAASGDAPLQVSFTASPGGGVAPYQYNWTFGDSSSNSSLQYASHTYTSPGSFTATCTLTDSEGTIKSASTKITVTEAPQPNQPPSCSITPSVTEGNAPLTVRFTAQGEDPEGGTLIWYWAFGDGASGHGSSVTHEYDAAGTYSVWLSATDEAGESGYATVDINVSDPPDEPVIIDPLTLLISASSESGDAPLPISFTAAPGGGVAPYQYNWTFGDGSSNSSLQYSSHTYTSPGSFTVTCTLTDSSGNTKSAYKTITVNEVPADQLTAFPSSLTVPLENTANIELTGGSGFYRVSSSDTDIVSYTLTDSTVTVTGESLGSADITVQDSDGKSVKIPVSVTQKIKAIIVAGSGPYSGNALWDNTLAACKYAYLVLMSRGYTHETILFLSADEINNIDIDGDGKFNEMDNYVTNDRLKNGITDWASDAKDVLVYMTGHGNSGKFRINPDGHLEADELSGWLTTLKSTIPGEVVFVYDSCYSGSFIPEIKNSGITSITSTGDDDVAFFTSNGQLSFSSFFFQGIFNGENVTDSFLNAKNSTQFTYTSQCPMMDDNGNGIGNDDDDCERARDIYIGSRVETAEDIPAINDEKVTVSSSSGNGLTIHVESVISGNPVEKVWAVITPPDLDAGTSSDPVLDLPVVELARQANGGYMGVFSKASASGLYNVALFVEDNGGNRSFPVAVQFTRTTASSSCLSFMDDLGIDIPCVKYAGSEYYFSVRYQKDLTWAMSAMENSGTGDLCATMSDNFDLTIPCLEFLGTRYGFVFRHTGGNALSRNLAWDLDVGSLYILP
ncbi:exported hypothetical protein [Desulfamplus magnetovallimortis]|uniref:PKD domain-containing protein n=1 Tax=Desulfamplus magnetovallimortis TaxID=1246637 RepID=A0A1W1H7Y4_9BACT|nr:PKD domain-containing protein [Desulfamplus magnetovallimortis]SLM28582.1 exported hypothetical protein [Desulfamplus magnetovallimortis]